MNTVGSARRRLLASGACSRFSGTYVLAAVAKQESLRSLLPLSCHNRCFSENKAQPEHNKEDPSVYRFKGIKMHPESVSQRIFPDKTVYKRETSMTIRAKKELKRRPLELEHGYFWMIRELDKTDGKPILSNDSLIPEKLSERMPFLKVTTMEDKQRDVIFPDHLIENNRLQDPNAQCSFVAVSFRDFGYKMIPKWITPIQEAYGATPRVQTLKINLLEGGWVFRAMAPLLRWMMLRNTPQEERSSTYLYFGDQSYLHKFQVKMGFHNLTTCFVFLLDGIGRVRWVGSGSPNDEEMQLLLHTHIPQLLPKMGKNKTQQIKS